MWSIWIKTFLFFLSASMMMFYIFVPFRLTEITLYYLNGKKHGTLSLLIRKLYKYLFGSFYCLYLELFESQFNKIRYRLNDIKEVVQKEKNVLIICNHPSEGDFFVLWRIAYMFSTNFGDVSFMLKQELKRVFPFGSAIAMNNYIFLSRTDRNADLEHIRRYAVRKTEAEENDCVILFPEGTDYSQPKWEGCVQKFPEWKNTPNVLKPKAGAFYQLIKNRNINYIIDLTLSYSKPSSSQKHPFVFFTDPEYVPLIDVSIFKTQYICNDRMILVEDLASMYPKDCLSELEHAQKWLDTRFKVKGELLSSSREKNAFKTLNWSTQRVAIFWYLYISILTILAFYLPWWSHLTLGVIFGALIWTSDKISM